MFGVHVKLFNDEQWEAAKSGLVAAGHMEVTSLKSNTATLLAKIETEFPELWAGMKKGIADYKDSSKSGGEKAVAVALDVLAIAPTVIADIKGIKSILVAGVTQMFADDVSDFKNVAASTITNLVNPAKTTTTAS